MGTDIKSTLFSGVTIQNTIIASNSADTDTDIYATGAITNIFSYSCSPTFNSFPPGVGNIQANPLFIDADKFRVQPNSPCLNAGTNQAWMAGDVDLDGWTRIDRFSRLVDMGCYEYIPGGMMFGIR